jgi:hypothetical protein
MSAAVTPAVATRPPSGWAEWRRFWWADEARRLQGLRWVSLLVLALLGAQWFRLDKDLAGAERRVSGNAEVAYVAPVAAMRMASLGNQGFVADVLYLRAAHYFVDHLITDSRLPWIDLYLDAVWGLDAHIRQTYRWGPQVIKLGQRIDDDVARRANRFARLGLAYYPDDPWLFHEIAYNLRYTVKPVDETDRQRLRDLALRYLETAYSFPGFTYDPAYLVGQYSRAGRGDDSVRAALATYAQATAEQRLTLRRMLQDRDKQAVAQQLGWFDVVRQRDRPWADDTLSMMLGPRTVPTPPLQASRPEGWLREVPTPPELLKQLGIQAFEPVGDTGWRADELAGRGLPEGASATSVR